jgi:hypothetical protein
LAIAAPFWSGVITGECEADCLRSGKVLQPLSLVK